MQHLRHMRGLALLFLFAPATLRAQVVDPAIEGAAQKVEQGRSVAAELMCIRCHTVNFTARNKVPSVAGQPYAYVVKRLEEFRASQGETGASMRHTRLHGATDEQIDALGQYIASLGRPAGGTPASGPTAPWEHH